MEEVERLWVGFLSCSECEVASISSLSRRMRFGAGAGPGRLRTGGLISCPFAELSSQTHWKSIFFGPLLAGVY